MPTCSPRPPSTVRRGRSPSRKRRYERRRTAHRIHCDDHLRPLRGHPRRALRSEPLADVRQAIVRGREHPRGHREHRARRGASRATACREHAVPRRCAPPLRARALPEGDERSARSPHRQRPRRPLPDRRDAVGRPRGATLGNRVRRVVARRPPDAGAARRRVLPGRGDPGREGSRRRARARARGVRGVRAEVRPSRVGAARAARREVPPRRDRGGRAAARHPHGAAAASR